MFYTASDLAGDFLQECNVGGGVLSRPGARHREGSQTAVSHQQGHDRERPHTVGERLPLGGIFLFDGKVATHEGPVPMKHQPDVAVVRGDFESDDEVRRWQRGLEHEEPEDVAPRVMQEDRGAIERDHATEGAGHGLKQRIPLEVRDDGVVDLQQGAVALGLASRYDPSCIRYPPPGPAL
jgi:hypothetical protein